MFSWGLCMHGMAEKDCKLIHNAAAVHAKCHFYCHWNTMASDCSQIVAQKELKIYIEICNDAHWWDVFGGVDCKVTQWVREIMCLWLLSNYENEDMHCSFWDSISKVEIWQNVGMRYRKSVPLELWPIFQFLQLTDLNTKPVCDLCKCAFFNANDDWVHACNSTLHMHIACHMANHSNAFAKLQ